MKKNILTATSKGSMNDVAFLCSELAVELASFQWLPIRINTTTKIGSHVQFGSAIYI